MRDTKGGRIMFTQTRLLPYVRRTFNVLVCETGSNMKGLRIVWCVNEVVEKKLL